MRISKTTVLALFAAGTTAACAGDWPQWRGPDRDAISDETGLLQAWPEGGPPQAWVVQTPGEGYAAPAIVGNRIYITGSVDSGRERTGELYALSTTDGSVQWRTTYGPEWGRSYSMSRTTPTYVEGRLYLYSAMGTAACFDARTGERRWSVDTIERFGGQNIRWGIAESPLVLDNMFICHPGGPDSSVVALNAATGETVWTTRGLSEASAYCSPISHRLGDRTLIVTQTAENIVGIDAATGEVLWKSPQKNRYSVHPNTPVIFDDKVFISSGYGHGSQLLALKSNGLAVERVWAEGRLDSQFQGTLYVRGRLFGSRMRGPLVCLDPATGKTVYEASEVRKASILYADNRLYAYNEKGGTLLLLDVREDGYAVNGSTRVSAGDGPHWAHPALSRGMLYIRHGTALVAYNVKAQ